MRGLSHQLHLQGALLRGLAAPATASAPRAAPPRHPANHSSRPLSAPAVIRPSPGTRLLHFTTPQVARIARPSTTVRAGTAGPLTHMSPTGVRCLPYTLSWGWRVFNPGGRHHKCASFHNVVRRPACRLHPHPVGTTCPRPVRGCHSSTTSHHLGRTKINQAGLYSSDLRKLPTRR